MEAQLPHNQKWDVSLYGLSSNDAVAASFAVTEIDTTSN